VTANVYGLRLLGRPGVRRTILLVVVATVLLYRIGQFVYWTGQIQWGYDFSAYWTAGGHVLNGQALYLPDQLAGPYAPQRQFLYLYPPPLAAFAIPFAALFGDYRLAEWVWTAIGAAIVVWTVLALRRSEAIGECYPAFAGRGRWLLVGLAFAFPPIVAELVLGNVNILLLGLLTAAWLGVRADRGGKGHDSAVGGAAVAGIAIGIATVVKVFPGLLILWLLLTRRYRAAAWAIGAVVVVAVVTLPFTGLQPWLDYPTVLANLSAPSDTTDTLAPTVWLAPLLGFTISRTVVTVIGLVIVVWSARVAPARISFAIAVLVSVLIAPALYQHYLAILVLPLLLALGAGVSARWLAVPYLLMWGGQQNALGDLAWIVNKGLPTAGALLLLGLLLARLRDDDASDREGAEDGLAGHRQPDQGPAGAVVR
jgi:alpha-1,2-mannosyltransferase